MLHLPQLISDLTLILAAAALVTLLFKKLKQPVVLGYIIAGLLVGPNFQIFPTIVEVNSIRIWADIGVIFLLFGLGLEFSFKRLLEVGGVAVVAAFSGIGFTMLVGYQLGKMLNWGMMDCIFLGGILAIASTTIIIRAFDELGVKTQKFTGIVTGILIIEDLVAVVLMVILTTLSISRTFEGTEMLISVFKLVFFLILWFVSGIFFLPTILKKLRNFLNAETLLIISLALCFSMVVLAAKVGFSSALGAFIMGSILAETTKAEKIEHILRPLKDLFGAIFFVSVGMLIDPNMLVVHAYPILLATLVLLIVKPLFVALGSLVAGQPLNVAVQTGMSLSQIGEFSFIIATLGLSLKVTSDYLYPIAVAVSVLTTFTTPFMIRFSPRVQRFIESLLPAVWKIKLNRYSRGAQNVVEASEWNKILRYYFINVIVFSVVSITIILMSTQFILPVLANYKWSKILTAFITLVLVSPFLWALAFRGTQREAYARVWARPLQRGPLIILMLSRILLAIFYVGFLLSRLFSMSVAVAGAVLTVAVLLVFSKKIKLLYGKIELRFLANLNERKDGSITSSPATGQELAPWDTHLASFELHVYTPYVGKTLQESKIRENFGINIAIIQRGDLTINVPSRDERLYPNDLLSVIGTDEQLRIFKEHLESTKKEVQFVTHRHAVTLHHFTISKNSMLLNKNIRGSGIRELSKGLVVGIERNGQRILNPESDLVFEENDVVWVVGNEKRLQVLLKDSSKG